MLALYVFCLVLGGGFLLVSVLGDAFDADAGDMDGGLELDSGLDLDGGLDGGGEFGADADIEGDAATKVLSLRTLVYALFGFGAVGTLLSLWGPGSGIWNFVLAVLGGLLSGGTVTGIFQYLQRTDTGAHRGEASLIGLSGSVTLPLSEGVPGRVVVERGNRRIALRALPYAGLPAVGGDTARPEAWRSVVVVEMEGGIARVAPIEEDLALEP